jgi:hypothetical protein
MSNKTHYRKVFKSDHLGVADLEDFVETGHNLVFTIKEVKQEFGVQVAGRNIDANIVYFEEQVKPLVVNATNSATLKMLSGGSPFVEDWAGMTIGLYIDSGVKMKGDTVGGVRIHQKKYAKKDDPVLTKILEAKTEEALREIWVKDCKSNSVYGDAIANRNSQIKSNTNVD